MKTMEFHGVVSDQINRLAVRMNLPVEDVVRLALGTYDMVTDPKVVSEKDRIAVLGPKGAVKKILLVDRGE